MPVRIYDIAKKHGLENKEILARAKELGISAAKVPSSSLDKITAEYLEENLGPLLKKAIPPAAPAVEATAPAEPSQEPTAAPAESASKEAAPEPEPEPAPQPPAQPVQAEASEAAQESSERAPIETPAPATAEPSVAEAPSQVEVAAPPVSAETPAKEPTPPEPAAEETPAPAVIAPAPAPVPEVKAGPKVGEKIGFIQLPPKPGPKVGDKVGTVNLPGRPGQGRPGDRPQPGQPAQQGRGGFQQRGGQQGNQPGRPGQAPAQGQGGGFQRPGQGNFQRGGQQGNFRGGQGGRPPYNRGPLPGVRPAEKSGEAKFVPPTTGELINMKPPIIVRDLAERLNKKPFQLIADLMALNVFANVNQGIDEVVAQKICAKYGFRFEVEKRERGAGVVHAPVRKIDADPEDKPETLKSRPPVVTIMGHVDHGKTTLLDVIRKANVASGEAGGITQHIGAYTISIPHPDRPEELQQITFLDTPGHAAFSSMRARGANVTDIVILVVAANDGVMPQTVEALNHAKAAKVPIIVAVNKIDHPAANTMRVRQQLQEHGLVPEDWGGQTIFQEVSALTKLNIEKLLGILVLQAEIMELKANPDRLAKGNVIESGLEPGGPTVTVLVRKGTVRIGDIILCGPFFGKARALISEDGKRMKEAGPSHAVKVLGLNGVPDPGIEFTVMKDERSARDLAEERGFAEKTLELERRPKVTLENLFATLASEQSKVLKVVIKADTQGSVEAIVEALRKIDSDKVTLEIIHHAVGTITESDVILSSASKAIVLGFHTRVDNGVADVAKREGVQIKLYAIIYELIDQVKEAMAGLLDPLTREVTVGQAEVRKVFALSKGGNVAGCVVLSGRIVKGKMRIVRRKGTIYEGVSLTLRRFQDEVNEVRAGMECGIRLDGFDDYQLGDLIECYNLEKTPQKL